MIKVACRHCGSYDIQKNGRNKYGQQKYHCKACHFYGTLETKEKENEETWRLVEKLQLERLSQRAISRITGISRSTIIKKLKKAQEIR